MLTDCQSLVLDLCSESDQVHRTERHGSYSYHNQTRTFVALHCDFGPVIVPESGHIVFRMRPVSGQGYGVIKKKIRTEKVYQQLSSNLKKYFKFSPQ